jgi:hypothetical protein
MKNKNYWQGMFGITLFLFMVLSSTSSFAQSVKTCVPANLEVSAVAGGLHVRCLPDTKYRFVPDKMVKLVLLAKSKNWSISYTVNMYDDELVNVILPLGN